MNKYNPLIPLLGFIAFWVIAFWVIDVIGPGTSPVANPDGPVAEIHMYTETK